MLAFYLTYILALCLANILAFYLAFYLVVEVRQCPLRSGFSGWGPAVPPTVIGGWRLSAHVFWALQATRGASKPKSKNQLALSPKNTFWFCFGWSSDFGDAGREVHIIPIGFHVQFFRWQRWCSESTLPLIVDFAFCRRWLMMQVTWTYLVFFFFLLLVLAYVGI